MSTMADLRAKIDEVDHKIIALLAERSTYVKQLTALKKTDHEVVASDRQQHIYETRRQWAAEVDLDPDLAERLYRTLIDYNIEQQRQHLNLNGK